jgi:hypothetical protein
MDGVVESRKPFGLFLDIMDFKCVAVDGKPCNDEAPFYLRFDSHGRMFRKSKDTNDVWELVPREDLVKWLSTFQEEHGRS